MRQSAEGLLIITRKHMYIKQLKLWTLAILLLCTTSVTGKVRKTLFVIIDGIPADVVERLQPPVITDIARRGIYSRAYCGGAVGTYSETPTISAIGYTNILTGTWMNKHGVKGNSNMKPNYNYPTVFRIAKDQKQPVTTAVYSSWTDNRTILLGEGKPETRYLAVDYAFDGYDRDEQRFPHEQNDLHIQAIDAQVCRDAANCIASKAPHLNWLYLWYTDDAYHHNGGGAVADEAVMTVDRQLAAVWNAVREREKHHNEEWLVIVTTDHGRNASGQRHGGQSTRERTVWMAVNTPKVNEKWGSSTLSQVDILPTICQFMHFELSEDIRRELDGQSFIGSMEADSLQLTRHDKCLRLHWKPGKHRSVARIYVSVENKKRSGGSDIWIAQGETDSSVGHFDIDLSLLPQGKFCKVALLTDHGQLTGWFNR